MKKNKAVYKLFKFYESAEIVFDHLIQALQTAKWLEKKLNYKSNSVNKIKIGAKVIHSKILIFESGKIIEIEIVIKGVGVQTIGFKISSKKKASVLEMAMQINFNQGSFTQKELNANYSKIKNNFIKNASDIDNLIRDNLIKNGYKPFF